MTALQKHLGIVTLLLACVTIQDARATTKLEKVTTEQQGTDFRVKISLSIPVQPWVSTAESLNRIVLDFPDTLCSDKNIVILVGEHGIRYVQVVQRSIIPLIARVTIDLDQSYPYAVTNEANSVILTVDTTDRSRASVDGVPTPAATAVPTPAATGVPTPAANGVPISAATGDLIGALRTNSGTVADTSDGPVPEPATSSPSADPLEAPLLSHSKVSSDSTATDEDPKSADDTPPETGADTDQEEPQTGPYLNPGWLIPGIAATGLIGAGTIFGVDASEGYGWQKSEAYGDTSGSASILQPYAGFYSIGQRTSFVGAYYPTIELFNSGTFEGKVLHSGGFDGGRRLSRKWRLFFSGRGTHGPADLRDFEVLSLGEPEFALPTDILTTGVGSLRLKWLWAQRHQVWFEFEDSYVTFVNGPSNNVSQARVLATNGFGHESEWYVYGEESQYSLLSGCTQAGFGLGISASVTRNTRIGVEGGPQFPVGNCNLPTLATFAGFFERRLSHGTTFTLRARRRMVDPTLPQYKWIDTFSAGIEQNVGRRLWLDLRASYVYTGNSLSSITPDYQGFLGPNYRSFVLSSKLKWFINSNLSLVPSFEYFKRENPSISSSIPRRRSWIFLSLVWNSKGSGRR